MNTLDKTKRMAATGALAALVVLAGGCSKANDPDASASQSAASVAPDMPQPGEYKQTIEFVSFDVPGMPEEQKAQLKTMMSSTVASQFCLTPQNAADGYRSMLQKIGNGTQCSFSKYDTGGGKLDAALSCSDASGQSAQGTMIGAIGPDGSDVTTTLDQGPAKIVMHTVTERTGECTD